MPFKLLSFDTKSKNNPYTWSINTDIRRPTPQGKQRKWWKVIPDRKNACNLKMSEKHREFEHFFLESWNQGSIHMIMCYFWTSRYCHFITKIHRENECCTWKSQGKQGILLSEMSGNHEPFITFKNRDATESLTLPKRAQNHDLLSAIYSLDPRIIAH